MDQQCDRCGKQLPTIQPPPDGYELGDDKIYVGYHVVLGQDNHIFADGEPADWEPGEEFDLCPKCKEEFLTLWKGFYRS